MARINRSGIAYGAVIVSVFLPAFGGQLRAGDFPVTWDGGAPSNNWSDGDNWNPNVTGGPCNDGGVTFAVTIGGGLGTIVHNVAGTCDITSLTLGNSTLSLSAGTSLTVLEAAELSGTINALGGDLTANGPGTAFVGDTARVLASNGSCVTIAAPAYSSVGLPFTTTILSAEGENTKIDLSSVTSFSAAFDDDWTGTSSHTITATNGGKIDLSAVPEIDPPVRFEDWVSFVLNGDLSIIDLGALQTISGVGGRTQFHVSNSAIQNFPALTRIEDTWFVLLSGGRLHVNGPPASYSVGWPGTTTIMSADGVSADGLTPTLLDLSSVTTLSAAFDDDWTGTSSHTITATNGGKIDLSAVPEIDPPVRFEDWVSFTLSGDSSTIRLDALTTITDEGGKMFVGIASGGNVQMGNVSNADIGTMIDLNADSTLSVISLQGEDESAASIKLNKASDRLEVFGSLLLGRNVTIDAPEGGTLSLGGDFLHEHIDTANVNLRLSHVECVGTSQRLEIGDTDFGTAFDFVEGDTFGYEQLTVGQPGQATTVELVDLFDNHDACVADALYLFGIEDDEGDGLLPGLRILGGSTLALGNLNAYALLDLDEDGDFVRTDIRDLFACGETEIPFNHNGNNGFISIAPPPPALLHDLNGRPGCDCANSGYIDPRSESDNGIDLNQGITEVTLCFNRPIRAIGGADPTAAAFSVRETGGATPPNIVEVETFNETRVTLTLDRPITPQEWTTIQADIEDSCGNAIPSSGDKGPGVNEPDRVDIGFLPCDIDQSSSVSPLDLFRFRQFVNGVATPDVGQLTDFIDTDRNGELSPTDLFLFRQLINGVNPPATMLWAGASMNNPRP